MELEKERAGGETEKDEREENWNNEIEGREILREKGEIKYYYYF